MLKELKRCNTIGTADGFLFLVYMIIGKDRISKAEIQNRCALENGVTVNCPGAIAFLDYLGLASLNSDCVIPTEQLNLLAGMSGQDIIDTTVKLCISRLAEDGIFDRAPMGFDPVTGHLSIKRTAFPLSYAAIRNFLTVVGVLEKENQGEIGVLDAYEESLAELIRSRKKKLTQEQLLVQQEEKAKRGLEAEEFVLQLEKNRLPGRAAKIKRISDYDVGAGYDIVSYNDENSGVYDRFIEVKCYLGEPHFFWSENEYDVARIKRDKYILCLVDYNMIGKPSYCPEYIINPAETIFENTDWLVSTASFRIKKV